MDAEEARRANCEKQRRFQQRHRRALDFRQWQHRIACPRVRITLPLTEGMRVFALSDPRDEQQLPRYIGIARINEPMPCQHLWEVRHLSRSPWAQWLRVLGVLKLRPVVHEVIGRTFGVKWSVAVKVAIAVAEPYGKPPWALWPNWLTHRRTRVGRLGTNGRIRRYRTIKRAKHLSHVYHIGKLAHLAERDQQGRLWFED